MSVGESRGGRRWFLRIVSILGIVAVFAGIGWAMRKGDTFTAGILVFVAAALAFLVSWSWTGALFGLIGRATRYVEGVEGEGRHEWYAFKSLRVRVFLDENRQPWFALSDIAHILSMKPGDATFESYGPRELAVPESASEPYLSERGLRRLVKYSRHRDAGALGAWIERDVLRVLRNRAAA